MQTGVPDAAMLKDSDVHFCLEIQKHCMLMDLQCYGRMGYCIVGGLACWSRNVCCHLWGLGLEKEAGGSSQQGGSEVFQVVLRTQPVT